MTKNERVKYLRKDVLNLTLEKFGEPLDMKKNSLSAIENGRPLTEKAARAICRHYNVNPEWLLEGTGEIFLPIDRTEKIKAWAEHALQDAPDSFKYKFVAMLTELPDEWWEVLEKKALELFREEDPDGARAIEDEVEEYRRQLELEKSREESSSRSLASGE